MGGSAPRQPTPQEEAQAQIQVERARQEMQAQREAEQRMREEEQRRQLIAQAGAKQNQVYQGGQTYYDQQLAGRGFDAGLASQYGMNDLYNSALDQARISWGETDVNPLFNASQTFNQALNDSTKHYRTSLTKDFNSLYGDDYSINTFDDAIDDPYIQAILDSQRNDALAQIDAALARGQINQVGYGRATTELENALKGANVTAQDAGMGVLTGYRNQLDTMRQNELNKINNAGFDNAYTMDAFNSLMGNRVNSLTGRLEGDIQNTVGSMNFFDPSSYIAGGGAFQGYYNPSTARPNQANTSSGGSPLLNAMTEEERKRLQGSGGAGLGNTGGF